MKILRTAGILAAAVMVCSSFPSRSLVAHHGEAGAYTLDETIKLEGVVREVRWGNPHVIVAFDVKGADGVEQWAIELSSINTMQEGGATQDTLKSGDRIIVSGHRHRTTKLLILPRSIQRPDGTVALQVPVRRGIFGQVQQPR